MFIFCHDQRAYPRACLPHVSLNELLESQEAKGGKMDEMKEQEKRQGKEKERKSVDETCGAERRTLLTARYVCMMFRGQSAGCSCQPGKHCLGLRAAVRLRGKRARCRQCDRQTDTCRHPELSNPSPLSRTKQRKIRDTEDEIVCQSRLDRRKTKFSLLLSLLALCRLFVCYNGQLILRV